MTTRLLLLAATTAALQGISPRDAAAAPVGSGAAYYQVQGQAPPAAAPNVDRQVTTTRTTTVWYADPVWIIVGIFGLALVIALILAATRSAGRNSTTVVR